MKTALWLGERTLTGLGGLFLILGLTLNYFPGIPSSFYISVSCHLFPSRGYFSYLVRNVLTVSIRLVVICFGVLQRMPIY